MMADQTHFPGFDDGKAPDALRTIGEVARALHIRQHVLRYWEEQFPMLNPVKRSGGRRYYRPEDVELLATIDRLVHQEGYTLRGARQVLEGADAPPTSATAVDDSPADDLKVRIRTIRETLAAALAAS